MDSLIKEYAVKEEGLAKTARPISYVIDEKGCWLVTHPCRNTHGYGVIKRKGKQLYTHRVIYKLYKGSIPEGECVLHKCGRGHKGCINPNHLYLGTHKENSRDMIAHGTSQQGEKHYESKLKDNDVKLAYESSLTQTELARRFKVNTSTIYSIKSDKTWVHITNSLVKGVCYNPSGRFSKEEVIEIFRSKESVEGLAQRYDTSRATIRKIQAGKRHSKLTSTLKGDKLSTETLTT